MDKKTNAVNETLQFPLGDAFEKAVDRKLEEALENLRQVR